MLTIVVIAAARLGGVCIGWPDVVAIEASLKDLPSLDLCDDDLKGKKCKVTLEDEEAPRETGGSNRSSCV